MKTPAKVLVPLLVAIGLLSTPDARADLSVTYLYNDASGNPVAAADEEGNLLWRKFYRPFGAPEATEGPDLLSAAQDNLGFTGHVVDRGSGLVYMGARFYNPHLGVFYSPDPAPVTPNEPFSYNRYAYANQNPYRFVDPDGEAIILTALLVASAAMTAYDTYQAYKRGGVEAAAEQLAFDAALSLVGGGIAKVGAKAGKLAFKLGKKVLARSGRLAKGTRVIPRVTKAKTVGCFVAGTAILTPSGTKAIESLSVGERVASIFPDQPTKVDETWRRVRLGIGSPERRQALVRVELVRSVEWLSARNIKRAGDQAYIDLLELDVDGLATVEAITPIGKIDDGPGRIVLTTVNRPALDLYRLDLDGDGASFRVTGTHPIYSLDRDSWVRVRDLQVGEWLQTAEGAVLIAALERERGQHRVYNLEVEGEHEYLVGELGLRVHNACPGVSASKATVGELPGLDATGKVHGALPDAKDLGRYSRERLEDFRDDLQKSVGERIRKTVELGRDRAHGQRQGAEQELIRRIEKFLED